MTIISPNVHIVKESSTLFFAIWLTFSFGVALAGSLGLILEAVVRALIARAAE